MSGQKKDEGAEERMRAAPRKDTACKSSEIGGVRSHPRASNELLR